MFDATTAEEFERCLKLAKKEAGEVKITPASAKMLRQTIQSITKGRYGITNFGDQVRLILGNDELSVSEEGNDAIIDKTNEVIQAYIEEHPVVKYYDSQIAKGDKLIFVVRDPSLIRIISEVAVQEL